MSELNKSDDKTLSAWLLRDEKQLAEGLSMDIFNLSTLLQREPVSVLRHLNEERAHQSLSKSGLGFKFEPQSDEECEFIGLTFSGVPIESALKWCLATNDRPCEKELTGQMLLNDFRPAMYMARDLGIWFSTSADIEDMIYLQECIPSEIVEAAIEEIIEHFDAPTPAIIRQVVDGDITYEGPAEFPPLLRKQTTKFIGYGRKAYTKGVMTKPKRYRRKSSSFTKHTNRRRFAGA